MTVKEVSPKNSKRRQPKTASGANQMTVKEVTQMTVNEVSQMTGVSVRTLHYYDEIGLLAPSAVTEAGYRLYDETALERLQQILLFRELEFPLKEIAGILDSADFDRIKALEQQITLLTLKKEHLEKMIAFACKLKQTGGKNMDFSAFDKSKLDEYAKQAKEQWGNTAAYKEFEDKNRNQGKTDFQTINQGLMDIFAEFGTLKEENPEAPIVQQQVKKLQEYITEHYYNCTEQLLAGLGEMYSGGNEFTENIDKAGGAGCAAFATKAIRAYCR